MCIHLHYRHADALRDHTRTRTRLQCFFSCVTGHIIASLAVCMCMGVCIGLSACRYGASYPCHSVASVLPCRVVVSERSRSSTGVNFFVNFQFVRSCAMPRSPMELSRARKCVFTGNRFALILCRELPVSHDCARALNQKLHFCTIDLFVS